MDGGATANHGAVRHKLFGHDEEGGDLLHGGGEEVTVGVSGKS
jgi:hypothetical protein